MKANISVNVNDFDDNELRYLKRLGLSDHEIQTYKVLVDCNKPMSAQDIASKLMVYPSAVYRIFHDLESLGLVWMVGKKPIRYQASNKSEGFKVAYVRQKDELARLLQLTGADDLSDTSDGIILGRQALYREYIKYAKRSEKEISVFAIGIAYSKSLHQAQEEAIKRGVYIRHVVQKLQPANYHIIHKWQRLGISVRHNPQKQGYHISIIDNMVALITFSDPENTEDRLTIISKNPTAVKLFQLQFEAIWQSAQKIEKRAEVA